MSTRVGIVGAAVTPFKGRWTEKTYYELAQMAVREAVADARMPIADVDAAFYAIYNDIFERTAIPEHAIHGLCGMQDKFGIRITTGGATGAYTMSAAHAYLAAGRFKTALVLGVEKATDCFDFASMSATPEVIKSIGWSGDSFFEQGIGWTASDSYAEVVLAYMDEHPGDLKPEITARISAQLSRQVKGNTYAQRQFDQVTPEEVMNSRLVVYPFKELEICVYTEGAAALILAEEETALAISRNSGTPVVWITGVGEANEHSFARSPSQNHEPHHVRLSCVPEGVRHGRDRRSRRGDTDRGTPRRLRPPARDQHDRIRTGAPGTRRCAHRGRAHDPPGANTWSTRAGGSSTADSPWAQATSCPRGRPETNSSPGGSTRRLSTAPAAPIAQYTACLILEHH